MIEGVDIDIKSFVAFLSGGNGLQGWITCLALVLMSVRQKAFTDTMAQIKLCLIKLEEALEDNTDVVRREREEKRASIRKL